MKWNKSDAVRGRRRSGLGRLAAAAALLGAIGSSAFAYNMGGLQVWVPAPWQTTNLGDYYGPNFNIKKLPPLALTGCRNGAFSGCVVATCATKEIAGLKATITDLTTKDGATIPASAVRLRYARPAHPAREWTPSHRFNALLDRAPETVPVAEVVGNRGWKPTHVAPIAMQPVWITVQVPPAAAAGEYEGRLTVESAEDTTPPVIVKLIVADWALPNPADFRILNLALQSQESVAKHYRVPLWSDRHFELLGESLKRLAKINSRQLAMNLTLDFYGLGGNEQTMVYWIKGKDGSYTHDFTAFDKYLETAAKAIGKPNLVRLNCWMEWARSNRKDANSAMGWGPPAQVSLFDPETGKLGRLDQPSAGTPEFVEFWRPVVGGALERLKARGWLDVTAFGMNSYCWGVHPLLVDAAHEFWPEGTWAYTSHNGGLGGKFKGTKPGVVMTCRYPEHIWGPGPGGIETLVKPRPGYIFHTKRGDFRDNSPLWVFRSIVERSVREGHDGVSDFGGDFFPIENPNSPGRFYCLGNGRGTGGPNNSTRALIAPGPDGAVATERFEAFREGLQVVEAMVFIQKAISGGNLPEDLKTRAQAALTAQHRHMSRSFVLAGKSGKRHFAPNIFGENLLEREGELFAVAAVIAQTGSPN